MYDSISDVITKSLNTILFLLKTGMVQDKED